MLVLLLALARAAEHRWPATGALTRTVQDAEAMARADIVTGRLLRDEGAVCAGMDSGLPRSHGS